MRVNNSSSLIIRFRIVSRHISIRSIIGGIRIRIIRIMGMLSRIRGRHRIRRRPSHCIHIRRVRSHVTNHSIRIITHNRFILNRNNVTTIRFNIHVIISLIIIIATSISNRLFGRLSLSIIVRVGSILPTRF